MGSYDFVIAGGGTAGLVLAARLSEDPSQSVIVLEAGSDHSEDFQVKTPAFYAALFGTDVDWNFASEAQSNLLGRAASLNQGRGLGGSSTLNAQVWAPPSREIIDAWDFLGNEGWNWDSISSLYNQAYTSPAIPDSLVETLGVEGWDRTNDSTPGPIKASYPSPTHPIRKAWTDSFEKIGRRMPNDPWVSGSIGAFSNLASVEPTSQERSDSAVTYYGIAKGRSNLEIITNATVEKILFSEGTTEATGLQYQQDSETKTVTARKEVIVAAGALQSPKLLELSGIGNSQILNQHGIPIVVDLPGVGEGLQDHLVCDIGFEAVDTLETRDALMRQEPQAIQDAINEYVANHTGILTNSGILTYAYLPTVGNDSPEGRERLSKLLDENRPSVNDSRAKAVYEVTEKALLNPNIPSGVYLSVLGQNPTKSDPTTGGIVMDPLPGKHLVLAGILSNPISRGTVHIKSSNVSDAPAIDPMYLSNPVDIELYAEHMLQLQSIASLSPLLGTILKEPLTPSRSEAVFTDLEGAKDWIRLRATSMWHPAGSCAMLPQEIGGVVDSHLKIHGVKNVRVVDSSIVPLLPPGNLQSTVYAVAEKAARLIKEEYGLH